MIESIAVAMFLGAILDILTFGTDIGCGGLTVSIAAAVKKFANLNTTAPINMNNGELMVNDRVGHGT
jgi:hypothetical protein